MVNSWEEAHCTHPLIRRFSAIVSTTEAMMLITQPPVLKRIGISTGLGTRHAAPFRKDTVGMADASILQCAGEVNAADRIIEPARIVGWRRGDTPEETVAKEWLVTNGLGGYASGTIAGVCTRRYHGKLIAALPSPLGRYVMLNHLEELLATSEGTLRLSGDEPKAGDLRLPDQTMLEEFRLEWGLPQWIFARKGFRLVKRIVMPYLQNTTIIEYSLLESVAPVELHLRPSMHFRPHENDVSTPFSEPYRFEIDGERLQIRGPDGVQVALGALDHDQSFDHDEQFLPELLYRIERRRGYRHEGVLWTPGSFAVTLRQGESLRFAVSTEPWDSVTGVAETAFGLEQKRRESLLSTAWMRESEDPLVAHLVLAADQFIITPGMRAADAARARATGTELRTVIAGYHWFTDWGRDTMISLEGLTLTTGRFREAGSILRTFSAYVRDGLIPNLFPEGENEGLYHTADATLWLFHAVHRYVLATADRATLGQLIPVLNDIIDHHLRGTRFGIRVDSDGLLRQGEEGYALTWMDAKMEGWVVTPRRGKAVEINALYYNALRLLAGWMNDEGNEERAEELGRHADRAKASFNERFWYPEGRHLLDVVDAEGGGNDAALRPNQILSISLDHPVLDEKRWRDVMDIVGQRLLTPVGLRSLDPEHPDYKRSYEGDLKTRDGAYHQGTVWSWLIGPYFDAWRKVNPGSDTEARALLEGLERHIPDAGVGSLSEIFEAEEPHAARGCIAQAWGVAELLRCLRALEK